MRHQRDDRRIAPVRDAVKLSLSEPRLRPAIPKSHVELDWTSAFPRGVPMPMKKIEELTGTGPVTREDGSAVGARHYQLTVWQQQHDDGRGGWIPGLFSVEGHVALEAFEGFKLVGESLILELEDGRRLPFFFSNSDGRIAARGPLA